jgi:hypothetical protein
MIISQSVTAQNQFTAPFKVNKGDRVGINLTGTWTATVTVQQKVDGTNFDDTAYTYTTNGIRSIIADFDGDMRVGVKTGGFTSGTVTIEVQP